MKLLIFLLSITNLVKSQISFCAILSSDQKSCKLCQPAYKVSADSSTCKQNIENCLSYTSSQYTSCDVCSNGYSAVKQNNSTIFTCSANFQGGVFTKCKPGFQLTPDGYCAYTIYNCMAYSNTLYDNNGNAKCTACFSSFDATDLNSTYTANYVLSQDQTACYPKIKGCDSQLDNQCVSASPDRPIDISKQWVCTTCKPGQQFQVDRCVYSVKPPCKDANKNYAQIPLTKTEQVCMPIPETLIKHCVQYSADKSQCIKCEQGAICTKDQFGQYPSSCWLTLQKSPNYILLNGVCVKEQMNCATQTADSVCSLCICGYKLENARYCVKDASIDLSNSGLYQQKVQFKTMWAWQAKRGIAERSVPVAPISDWQNLVLATQSQIMAQPDEAWSVIQSSATQTYSIPKWTGWTAQGGTVQIQAGPNGDDTVSFYPQGYGKGLYRANYYNNGWEVTTQLFAIPLPGQCVLQKSNYIYNWVH